MMSENFVREKVLEGIFVFVITLMVPYLITMVLTGGNTNFTSNKIEKGNKAVIITRDGMIEELGIEQYIIGVIAEYMPTDFEDEAFKVQAVLIRTYIERKIKDLDSINSEELDLPYMTFGEMRNTWGEDDFAYIYKRYEKAVSDTKGEMIMWQEQLIEPFFHSVSTGVTRGKEGYEYLQSVESPNDIRADNYLALITISKSDFITKLKEINSDFKVMEEDIISIITLETSDTSGYINRVKVGDTIMSSDAFLEKFGLQSLAFTIEEYNNNVRIISRGIGHGLGVSLYGSNQLALEGKNYIDILNHYYTNIEITHE